MEIIDLLQMANDAKSSDIILVAGIPPGFRVDGSIIMTDLQALTPNDIERLVFPLLSEKDIAKYNEESELDAAYTLSGVARFRINVHKQRGSTAAAIRRIPLDIPSIDELHLPKSVVLELCRLRGGLVLVTGQSGSGKTTTQASMIDVINSERPCHIITIEDPIEFVHSHRKAIVEQREVGIDSVSFGTALRNAMRQTPDVILVGEMRDLETITTAITASETGQLVFATLHTIDAVETVNRIIDVFPWRQQQQVRVQLASTLRGVVSQRLLPRAHGKGLIVACEVMLGTTAVKNLIREGSAHQLQSVVETNAKYGMQSMDQALISLYKKNMIDKDELLFNIKDKERDEVRAIIL
ncbi:MAG: PilT/PilU family type 4a pilus ATPase [Candidatus Omnitrophota bacterium]